MKWISGIIWWIAVLTGCSQSIDFRLPENEVLAISITNGGVPVTECKIQPGSSIHSELSDWIERNTDNWKASPASYVPGTVISGEGFSINVLNDGLILNYSGHQYTHSIEPDEFRYLICDESA